MKDRSKIKLPWTGYFAVDRHGKPLPGYDKPYNCEVPYDPAIASIGLEVIVPSGDVSQCKPFKSFLVETLAYVRDHGPVDPRGLTPARNWLWIHGLMEPIAIKKDDPIFCEILFRVTPNGIDFLLQHEAPIEW